MGATIDEKTCERCGAAILVATVHDPLNLTYGNPEVVHLDAERPLDEGSRVYRAYYLTGSGHYVERLSADAMYLVHDCPAPSQMIPPRGH